jgi:hypothetical protein
VNSTGPACIAEQAHGIELHQETDNSNSSVPDEFGDHVGKHEYSPVVGTTFALPVNRLRSADGWWCLTFDGDGVPCFVELSLNHEHRDDLQDEQCYYKKEDQYSEHLILETLLRVVCHEEGEADEQRLGPELALIDGWRDPVGTYSANCQ